MFKLTVISFIAFFLLIVIPSIQSTGKYSRELNEEVASNDNPDKPFRMYKLNVLWGKASKKLTGQKLKNLKTDLKDHDKQELSLKRIKAEGGNKDGLKEAEVRRNLKIILKKYDLQGDLLIDRKDNSVGEFASTVNVEKTLFRDKKLDNLWQKALNTGFDDEQLKLLKEEFQHHQDKIDEYHRMIEEDETSSTESSPDEMNNSIDDLHEDKSTNSSSGSIQQSLQDKHMEIKRHYEGLKSKVKDRNLRPKGKEFEEENVQKLWDLALKSDFTRDELESLRDELTHYQSRIRKLKYFEDQLNNEKLTGKDTVVQKEDSKVSGHLERKVKELNYKVDKIHNELESRILKKHIEL